MKTQKTPSWESGNMADKDEVHFHDDIMRDDLKKDGDFEKIYKHWKLAHSTCVHACSMGTF